MQSGKIRTATPSDREWLAERLTASWGSVTMAVGGECVNALECDALLAPGRSGILIYRDKTPDGTEVLVLEAFEPGIGVGQALMSEFIALARVKGKKLVSVVTTNDNTGALRFYQKFGFRLFELRPGAVDEARRTLKPEIPEMGHDGIPIHDEIELRLDL